jgi:hypothetical protein
MREDDVVVHALGSRRLSIRDWVRSVRGVQEMHWFSADDPVPLLVWLREKIRRHWPVRFGCVAKAG